MPGRLIVRSFPSWCLFGLFSPPGIDEISRKRRDCRVNTGRLFIPTRFIPIPVYSDSVTEFRSAIRFGLNIQTIAIPITAYVFRPLIGFYGILFPDFIIFGFYHLRILSSSDFIIFGKICRSISNVRITRFRIAGFACLTADHRRKIMLLYPNGWSYIFNLISTNSFCT